MKIYKPKQPYLIRVNIRKAGDKTEHLTFCETTPDELKVSLKEIFKDEIDVYATGNKTAIDLRESNNSVNGKSISFSFKGIDPKRCKEIILNKFDK